MPETNLIFEARKKLQEFRESMNRAYIDTHGNAGFNERSQRDFEMESVQKILDNAEVERENYVYGKLTPDFISAVQDIDRYNKEQGWMLEPSVMISPISILLRELYKLYPTLNPESAAESQNTLDSREGVVGRKNIHTNEAPASESAPQVNKPREAVSENDMIKSLLTIQDDMKAIGIKFDFRLTSI